MFEGWKAAYDSLWHHPGLAFVLCPIALGLVWRRLPPGPLRRALSAMAVLTAVDAFLTGALSPLPSGGSLAQNVSIALVIVGDFRLFVLLERFRSQARWPAAIARAAVVSFVVPVAQAIAIRAAPQLFSEQRRIYLAYELLFVTLGGLLLVMRYPSSTAKSPALGWYATSLLGFFVAQYSLWVASDVLILSGFEIGFALRLLPNAMYYGLFLIFAAWRAPQEATP